VLVILFYKECYCFTFLVRLEAVACGAGWSFTADVFYFIFFNARSLRCMVRPARNFAWWSILGPIL